MNAVFVVLAPLGIALFALAMERFEAIVVGTGPADSAKGRAAQARAVQTFPDDGPSATTTTTP